MKVNTATILDLPRADEQFMIKPDACGKQIGGVLQQEKESGEF